MNVKSFFFLSFSFILNIFSSFSLFATSTEEKINKLKFQAPKKEVQEKIFNAQKNPKILIKTSLGNITATLYKDKAPKTVANFMSYVEKKHFNGTIFHRVISNFMIQGGGFDKEMNEKKTLAPVINEADNGLKNDRGTLSMARTPDPHSATAQFFINLKDNQFLNHKSKNGQEYGYCVFGSLENDPQSLKTLDSIGKVKTTSKKGHGDVPIESVVINEIVRL